MSKNEEVKEVASFSISGEENNVSLPKNVKKIRLENSNSKLFYRVYGEVDNPDATLVVTEPNKVIIYKDGVSSGVLSSGAHRIYSDEDLKRKGFIFKKKVIKEPMVIDVIVFNPSLTYKGMWGTQKPIPYRDPETEIPVDIKGRGTYDLRIADVKKFHRTLVGSSKDFTIEELLERLNTYVYQIAKNQLAKIIHSLHLGYIDLPLHELDIAEAIQPIISETFNEQYGLYVPLFNIQEFTIDQDRRDEIEKYLKDNRDEAKYKKDAKELAVEIERLEDKEWEKEKFLIGLRREDYEKYLEVVKILGKASIESSNNVEKGNKGSHYCPKCGEQVSPNDEYCPSCGEKLGSSERVCPHCGKKSVSRGKYCPHCGKEM